MASREERAPPSGQLAVRVAPTDCGRVDCHAALVAALARCAAHGPGCAVVLEAGKEYPVRCPAAPRPSTTQIEAPAVLITNATGLAFGGDPADVGPRPALVVQYVNGGCAGVVVRGGRGVIVRHLVVDAMRMPFTVGTVAKASATAVDFVPEAAPADRAGVYEWNTSAYPWLLNTEVSAAVPVGARATRELKSVGLESVTSPYTSTVGVGGVVRLQFAFQSPARAALTAGTRVFLKHFSNLQSWGVHGVGVANMTVSRVSLWSVSGMGFRCDFCAGAYTLDSSGVAIKPGTARPMSITADAVHFMHTSGHIAVVNSSMQGQGDDGFNLHGNFVVLDRLVRPNAATYVDETGPGWLSAAPTMLVGDEVEFYSRRTLRSLGRSTLVAADNATVWFASPLPASVRRFDMFLSLARVASLEIRDSTFANSNARGVLVSGVNVTVENNTIANLSDTGVLLFEGGCGAQTGVTSDYTEGPFSRNVRIANNRIDNVAAVARASAGGSSSCAVAAVTVAACVPDGECGVSGGVPPAGPPVKYDLGANESGVLRVVPFALPSGVGGAVGGGAPTAARVTHLKFYVAPSTRWGRGRGGTGETGGSGLSGATMAVYSSTYRGPHGAALPTNHPTKRLAQASGGWVAGADGWWRAELEEPLLLGNGSYWLAHWYSPGQPWPAARAPGSFRWWLRPTGDPMPADLVQNWSVWTDVAGVAVPVAAEWAPVGGWCDVGGSLPPPIARHVGDRGGGRIVGPGAALVNGTALRNVSVVGNAFTAPAVDPVHPGRPWECAFVDVRNVAGVEVRGNTLTRVVPRGAGAPPDGVLASDEHVAVGDNRCFVTGPDAQVPCVFSNGG